MRDQPEVNIAICMLCHWVFEVKVLDFDHEVIGAWVRYHDVPVNFGCFEVGCWCGDWSVKIEAVCSHSKLHYVRLFLLGPNVADNAAIYELAVLGDCLWMKKKC